MMVSYLKKCVVLLLAGLFAMVAHGNEPATNSVDPMLDTTTQEKVARVTAVYGVTSDDYLPEIAGNEMRSSSGRHKSRAYNYYASAPLPRAVYFLGGPVFLLVLFYLIVKFIEGFERKREEEMRELAVECSPDDEDFD